MNTTGAARRARRKLGSILIAFSDPVLRHLTQVQLDKMGYDTWTAANTSAGLDILRQETVELVFCDLHVPGASGLDLLKEGRALYPKVKFVVVGTTNTAMEAMKSGAYDFLTKPVHSDDVRALVERLFGQHKSTDKVQVLSHSLDRRGGFESLLGESKSLKNAIDLASRAAQTDACVLITGETGPARNCWPGPSTLTASVATGLSSP
jgi:two-component system NtrC family response regulator